MDELKPLISVVIPYHNSEAYIAACIESVVGQTYENIEIIAIDNLSTDGSREIVEKMQSEDSRIKIFDCDRAGLAEARNKGIEVYSGDYLFFLDSDDVIPEDSIEILYNAAKKNNADYVCGSYRTYGKSGPNTGRNHSLKPFVSDKKEEIHKYILTYGKSSNFAWGKLYGRNIFEGVSYPEGKMYEDIAVVPAIIENCNCLAALDNIVYDYCQHSDSLTHSCDVEKQMDGLNAWIKNAEFYKENYPSLLPYAYENEMEFSFFLMGRIRRDGLGINKDIWKRTVDRIKTDRKEAAKTSFKMKVAMAIFAVSPRLAGSLFSNYSLIKNHTK